MTMGRRLVTTPKITLNYAVEKLDEVKFASDDDIAEFMGAIDFTDPQQQLLGE
jgi:hypothetical protein